MQANEGQEFKERLLGSQVSQGQTIVLWISTKRSQRTVEKVFHVDWWGQMPIIYTWT